MSLKRALAQFAKNGALLATILLVLAPFPALACVPADSGIQACPWAFKSSCGTTLSYTVVGIVNASASIDILNGAGGIVRTFSPVSGGSVCWDAKDGSGVPVPEGTYTVRLTITNGTVAEIRTCGAWVDNTAPSTTIAFTKSPGAGGSYAAGVGFTLAGYDTGSGIDGYRYSLNDGGWNCWDGQAPVLLNAPGTYTIRYKAIDKAGNYEIQTKTISVAGRPPDPTDGPTPAPTATATPAPDAVSFDVNPHTVVIHDSGLITYGTTDVSSTIAGASFAGSLGINLTHVPANSYLDVYLRDSLQATNASQFRLAAATVGCSLRGIACVLIVEKRNLQNGADIASATITMKATPEWVAANGGPAAIRILRYSEGTTEALNTSYAGDEGGLMVFVAQSPHGLSEFALSALEDAVVAAAAPVTPAGNTVNAAAGPAGTAASVLPPLAALALLAALGGCGAYVVFGRKATK